MKIDGALSHAMTGIQRGLSSAKNHAADIASAKQFETDDPSSLAEPLIGLKQDRLQVQASAQIVRAVDDMIGSLFDEKA